MEDNVLEALNRAAMEHSNEDIEAIIAFIRKSKAQFEGGAKPRKEGADIDVMKVLNLGPKADPDFERKI